MTFSAQDDERLRNIHKRFHALQVVLDDLPEPRRLELEADLSSLNDALTELEAGEVEQRQHHGDLVRTQQQLETERKHYEDLFEFAPDGYLVTSPQGLVLQANRAATRFYELEDGDLLGRWIWHFCTDETMQNEVRRWLEQATPAAPPRTWRVTMHTLHDRPFVADVHIALAHDAVGDLTELRWLVRDISDHAQAEEHLLASQQQLMEAQQIAHLGSWDWHMATHLVTWSDEMIRLCGADPVVHDLTYQDFLAYIHPDDRERVNHILDDALCNRQPFAFEYRVVRPGGHARTLLARGQVILDAQDKPVRMVGIAQDITDSRQASKQIQQLNEWLEQRVVERATQLVNVNEELRHEISERSHTEAALHTALERSQELYQISRQIASVRIPADVLQALILSNHLQHINRVAILLFDHPWLDQVPDQLMVLASWRGDASLVSMEGNRFAFEEYGFADLFVPDQPVHVYDVESDTRVNSTARDWYRLLKTRSVSWFPLVASGNWYGMLSLHSELPSKASPEDLRHLCGLVDQAAVAIYNTRLLETEERALHEAEVANTLKMKFLAMISHELRTPLTSIKGFATTLLADDVQWEPDQQRDFLQTIDQEADKLTSMIDQLLDLSRLQTGALRIKPVPVPFADILNTAMMPLQKATQNHHFSIKAPADLPPLNADRQRIAQVLVHLVGNAAKYTPPQKTINLTAYEEGQFVRIGVRDEGPGIPLEERTKIFQAFQRGEQAQRTRGAGLGLAICRALVEAHGGTIWVQDHEGPGTLMVFTLPKA